MCIILLLAVIWGYSENNVKYQLLERVESAVTRSLRISSRTTATCNISQQHSHYDVSLHHKLGSRSRQAASLGQVNQAPTLKDLRQVGALM